MSHDTCGHLGPIQCCVQSAHLFRLKLVIVLLYIQDTVITIEALAKYARTVPNTGATLSVRFPRAIGVSDEHHLIDITQDNHHIVNTREVEMDYGYEHRSVVVTITGEGCIILQVMRLIDIKTTQL